MSDGGASADGLQRLETALTTGTFEEVMAALEQVVRRLEEGGLPLAESVASFELGMRLAERCERFLDEAELRVRWLETEAEVNREPVDDLGAPADRW